MPFCRKFSGTSAFVLAAFILFVVKAKAVSLDTCVVEALKNSLPIASLQAQLDAASFAYLRERADLAPALSLSDESDYASFEAASGLSDGYENMANAEFSLDLQQWVAPSSRLNALGIQRVQLFLSQSKAQLRQEVADNYNKILVLVRQSGEQQETMDYVDSHIRDIQHLQASGLDLALDLLRAHTQRENLDLTANARDAELQDSLNAFRSLTGMELEASDFNVIPDLGASDFDPDQVDLRTKLAATVRGKLSDLDLESARVATEGKGRFSAPSLRLGMDHSFRNMDPANPEDRVYGALSFDAFDWGQKKNEARQAQAEFLAQTKETKNEERELLLYAQALAVDLEHDRKAFEISSDIVKDAQKGMEIAKVYYRQGKIKETDLLDVFSDYLSARDQRDTALLEALNKKAEWDALWQGEEP